jgi:peptide/nickel transport system permease protein
MSGRTEDALRAEIASLRAEKQKLAEVVAMDGPVVDCVFRFIDRMNDLTPEDNAEKVLGEYVAAMNAVIALSVVYTPRTARIVRATVLVVRETDYVQAAKACGARDRWIIWRHVLPNSMAPLIVQLTFIFAYAILAESILSFLGVGPPPPTPTWGNMIAEGKDYLREASYICFFPGLAVALTCLGLNLLGDGLRDVLDPRLRVQIG